MKLINKIKRAFAKPVDETPRKYLGASSIGHPCLRYLQNVYNGIVSETTPKQSRTFALGYAIESMIVSILENSSITIETPNNNNKQLLLTCDDVPDFKGHCDAIAHEKNAKHIIEIKSANQSAFTQMKKHGIKATRPTYYAQGQAYCGFSGAQSAVFIVFNKNTSDLHIEQFDFNPDCYEELKIKAKTVINSTSPAPMISDKPTYFVCQMCFYKKHCFGEL